MRFVRRYESKESMSEQEQERARPGVYFHTARPGHCPLCGQPLGRHPATSRYDNATAICSACGVYEAMNAAGDLFTDEQVAEVLGSIRRAEAQQE